MEGPRVFLFLILLFLFFSSPNTRPPSPAQQLQLDNILAKERYGIGLLNGSAPGDFNPATGRWINVTGFRHGDNFAWNLLPEVQSRVREQRQSIFYAHPADFQSPVHIDSRLGRNISATDTELPTSVIASSENGDDVYRNITGFIKGKWVRREPAAGNDNPVLNLSSLAPSELYTTEDFLYNVTGREGDVHFKLDQKYSENFILSGSYATDVKVEMTLKDEASNGDGWAIVLHGVHSPQHGSIILTSTSAK